VVSQVMRVTLWAVIAAAFTSGAYAENRNFVQLPPKALVEGKVDEYVINPFELASPSVVSIAGGLNTAAIEISPDGYVRLVRVLGTMKCAVPVQGKSVSFQATSSQRIAIWPVTKLKVTLSGDVLVADFSIPGWALALEVEYSGPSGLEVNFDGNTGILFSDQRIDTLLGADGKVMFVRSGKSTGMPETVAAVTPRMMKATERRLSRLPDGLSVPEGWYQRPTWTLLPLMPVDLEAARPFEASP